MAKRIAGVCYVKVDGAQLTIKGGLEAPISSSMRTGVMAADGPAGFKETPVQPSLKVTALFTDDFPLATLQKGTDMTITGEFANGRVYTLSEAHLATETMAKGEEGEIELEFHGQAGAWQ